MEASTMMTLKAFNEHVLKGKSIKELYSLIEDFKIEKIFLKVQIERKNIAAFTLPPAEMLSKINSYRLYISDTYKKIEKLGGTVERADDEEFALKFQENLSNIHEISYQIGDQFGKKEEFNLVFEESGMINDAINKEAFLKEFSELYIGEWRESYLASDYGDQVMAGTSWALNIHFTNEMPAVQFGGTNAYPYNFGLFDRLIKKDFHEKQTN